MRLSISTLALIVAAHCAALLCSAPVFAQGFQNLDQIDSLVAQTVGANIGEPGGARSAVDRRLRLAACPQTPAIEGPVFGAAVVRCDRLGWRIRVPLALAPAGQAGVPQQHAALIKKGDPVQLVAGDSTFSVTRTMIADEDGAVGDMIRVREDKTTPPVAGRVEPSGVVRIPGI
jgi:flagella basal body P-ring formation protein FlgA